MWCKKNYVKNNEPLTVIFNGKTHEYCFYYCLQCDKPTMPWATAVDFQIPASPGGSADEVILNEHLESFLRTAIEISYNNPYIQYRIQMVDQGPPMDAQCPSWAACLGYMGVAAAVCFSNFGSAVSNLDTEKWETKRSRFFERSKLSRLVFFSFFWYGRFGFCTSCNRHFAHNVSFCFCTTTNLTF